MDYLTPSFEKQSKSPYCVPIILKKNFPAEVKMQVYIGNSTESKEFKIVEVSKQIPKFFIFMPLDPNKHNIVDPKSSVKLKLNERSPRIAMWIRQSFKINTTFLAEEIEENEVIEIKFANVQDKSPLYIKYDPSQDYSLLVKVETMKMAGEVI